MPPPPRLLSPFGPGKPVYDQWPLGPRRLPLAREPAFLLPLATGAAGLLLLLSLTFQGLALQERVQVNALERLRREEDLLASAAHQVLAALTGSHRCLLALPLARWEAEGAACASPQSLADLRRLEMWAVPVHLLAWRPGADGLSAEMELQLEGGKGRAARKGRFGARLVGVPPRAVDPRARNLGGSLP